MKNRLNEIYNSAAKLFINKGYSRTQIRDIAKDIGLSTGMIYQYFTSKTDILNFTLMATIEPEMLEKDYQLPLDSKIFNDTEKKVQDTFLMQEELFANVLKSNKGGPFENMLSSAFDIITKYGTGILIIEKNPDSVGKIDDYYRKYRKSFFAKMLEYIVFFQNEGICRELDHTEYSTQLIIETLSWWGMHIMNDAYSTQSNINSNIAKEVCLDNLIHAYRIE